MILIMQQNFLSLSKTDIAQASYFLLMEDGDYYNTVNKRNKENENIHNSRNVCQPCRQL